MKQHKNLFGGAAALLVLAVFAVGILGTLLGGAGIYRRLTRRDQQAFNGRTLLQYVATRVRQAPGGVAVADFGGCDALVIPQQVGNETFITRVYCYDGWLMELFSSEKGAFHPRDGEKLLPAQGLELEQEEGLLYGRIMDDWGAVHELYLRLPELEGSP